MPKVRLFTEIENGMTPKRAARVRELRAEHSWRGVAEISHAEWGSDACWEPPSNQLAGIDLCFAAGLNWDD